MHSNPGTFRWIPSHVALLAGTYKDLATKRLNSLVGHELGAEQREPVQPKTIDRFGIYDRLPPSSLTDEFEFYCSEGVEQEKRVKDGLLPRSISPKVAGTPKFSYHTRLAMSRDFCNWCDWLSN